MTPPLEARLEKAALLASALGVSGSLYLSDLLPCVDYPQHLGLAELARRLSFPGAPARATYALNPLTYNGLFELATAALARLLPGPAPVETSGRLLFALALAGLLGAVVALLRALGRPPAYAGFFVPVVFSFATTWGFVNYTLGVTFAVAALAAVAVAVNGGSSPGLARRLAWVGVLGFLTAWTHVLAAILLCVLATAVAPEAALHAASRAGLAGGRRVREAARRACLALSPLLAGGVYCVIVFLVHASWDPNMHHDATLEGVTVPLAEKVRGFTGFASGLYRDQSDQVLLRVVLGSMLLLTLLAAGSRWRDRPRAKELDVARLEGPLYLPLAAMSAAYLITPTVLVGGHLIFHRLGQMVILGLVLALPRAPSRLRRWVNAVPLSLGVAAAGNLALHVAQYGRATRDASQVLDEMPPGRNATAVMYEPDDGPFATGVSIHLAALYAVRRHGDWAYSFARFLMLPVQYRAGRAPGWPARGWEFSPADYDPRCDYARTFDLVFVKAPAALAGDAGPGVRRAVFGADGDAVTALAHHGAYWAFETRGVPRDGEP